MRPRAVGAVVVAVWIAGCGGAGPTYDMAALKRLIRARLDLHRGYDVRAVSCPGRARLAKGVVIRCTATLAGGHIVGLRATELDDRGTVHLIAGEMLAENVERGIELTLAQRGLSARARCPEHVPVVVGRQFTCRVRYATRAPGRAVVTIIDRDGAFRLRFP